MGNVSRPSRAARPERPSRGARSVSEDRPKRSTTFTEEAEDLDFAEASFEDFADGDEFENTDEFEEFPDDGYEDFSTGNEQDEWEDFDDGDPDTFTEAEALGALDGPKKVNRPVRSDRPTRSAKHERPTRAGKQQRPQRPEKNEQDFEDDTEEEQVQVRHRRVREEDIVEDEPQMFSFTTDINKMTVSTMLADVDVNGYDFDDEGNLVRKDTADQSEEKADTGMQTVESLDELLKNIDSSSVIDTDAELGAEINAGTKNITGAAEDAKTEVEESETEEHKEIAAALDVISADTDESLSEPELVTDEPVEVSESPVDEDVKESASLAEYTEEEEAATGSVFDKLQQAAFKYRENVLNCGIESLSDVMVKYRYDGDYSVKPSNRNTLAMPNCKVYKNGRTEGWTKAQEVRLNTGDRISIDFGVGVVLPKGYGLHAVYNKDLLTKFGLDPVEPQKVFNNMQAATALSLSFIARNSMAYVARFQSLVELEVVKVNEEV